MADNQYTGRFGDTLRRLTALDAAQGKLAPQAVGGADTAGAFGAGSAVPPDMTQPAFGGTGSQGAMAQKPISYRDVMDQMPEEQKEALADQIEQHAGGNLEEAYRKAAEENGDTPKKRPSRAHMVDYLTELAMRTLAYEDNYSTSQGAFARAYLDVNAQRRAAAETRRLEARKDAETRRLEEREDSQTLRKEKREDTVHARTRAEGEEDYARNRKDKLSDEELKFQRDKELKVLEAKMRREEKLADNQKLVYGEGDRILIVDNQGNATPVTEEVEETRGSRGQGTSTRKVRKPVKARPPSAGSGLDQDTVQRMISDRIKQLASTDRKFKRLPPEEQSRIATEQVMREVNAVKTGAAPPPATQRTVIKFGELAK